VDKPPKLLGMRIPYDSNWVKKLRGKNRLTNIRRIYIFENTNQNLAQKNETHDKGPSLTVIRSASLFKT